MLLVIDTANGEIVHDFDLLFLEQVSQHLGSNQLGERAGQGRYKNQLRLVAQAALRQPPVGQKSKLQRRHWALDWQFGNVDDQPATLPAFERATQRRRPFKGVEIEDALSPVAVKHALGLVRRRLGAGRDDEDVVGELAAVFEDDVVVPRIDLVNLRLD